MMYDVAVIGSGPGGYVAAIRAGQLGLKTVCIEKMKELGGTCLNVGCIPSKALLHSTEMLFRLQKDGPRNGLHFSGNVDFSNMQKRKEEIVQGFNKGVEFLFRKNKVERVQGTAQLIDPNTILVGNQKISAKNIILATGSEPISLSFLPIDEKRVVSSTGALSLPSIPKRLLIIGAGVIGVELGSVYNRLGSEVQFIEFMDRVCPSMDSTISQTLEKILSKQGMKFFLSHKVTSAKLEKKEIILSIEGKEKFTLAGDVVLVSIGRKPYSKDLGLEKLGIEKDLKGFVQVDGFFRTIVPSIYAIGDLIDGPMLAHKAMEEGVAVAEFISGSLKKIEYMAIPNVAYTLPEAAGVGLTEEAAKNYSLTIKTGSFPFKANSRAKCTDVDEGLVKIIMEEKSRRIIGVHILGDHASELIAEATLAIQMKLTVDQLADTCHAHPTLAEAIKEAALTLSSQAIHI